MAGEDVQAAPFFIQDDVGATLLASWPVVLAYTVALGALCLHLYHGVWSALQTLGANHPRYNRYRRPLALFVAAVVFVGFMTVPVAVVAGIIA